MQIDGKVVLITGASEGIGAACATAFRGRGARLALAARNESKLKAVAQGDELITPADITVSGDRERAVDSTVKRYGRLDILINCAGVGLYVDTAAASIEQTRALFELNFFAALQMVQLAVPVMRRNHLGCIVNVSSIAGRITLPWFTLYSASKFALDSLTTGLRIELKRDGIHAISVCPGYVKTRFQQNVIAGAPPQSVRDSRRFTITAQECAAAMVRGVERNSRTVMTPRVGRWFVAASRLVPGFTESRLEQIYRRDFQPPIHS